MERKGGKYALIQFSPVPERMEFLNVGILLIVPELRYVGIKLSQSNARVERVFGRQPHAYLDVAKESFEHRLRAELSGSFDEERLSLFARKRANDIRLSPIMPLVVSDPESDLERLFAELVGKEAQQPRQPRIRRKLQEAFVNNRVEHYLEKPEEISLPEYGLKISAPYGYQNGCYNLIDGMRIPENVSDGLREVGKKAIEGNLLWKHFSDLNGNKKRLVVVGDFSKQSNEFYHAVEDQIRDANMKIYRLDNLRPLFEDIEKNAALHS